MPNASCSNSRLQRDVLLYTGTVDILSYMDTANVPTEIFLWYDGYKQIYQGIPAPLYYWKIIYDEANDEGVAFLGLNNPHSLDVTDYLCENICEQITWLAKYVPKIEMEERGHMTCCTIKELADNVDFVKSFTNQKGGLIKDAGLLKEIPTEVP